MVVDAHLSIVRQRFGVVILRRDHHGVVVRGVLGRRVNVRAESVVVGGRHVRVAQRHEARFDGGEHLPLLIRRLVVVRRADLRHPRAGLLEVGELLEEADGTRALRAVVTAQLRAPVRRVARQVAALEGTLEAFHRVVVAAKVGSVVVVVLVVFALVALLRPRSARRVLIVVVVPRVRRREGGHGSPGRPRQAHRHTGGADGDQGDKAQSLEQL
mmetsp:Transcript_33772/g.89067  ORF Transcript_33772/g.89067 Transcript_33772/m.89067 type:complete len:214 (-) Transcript_33772:192-833(-)